MGGFLEWGGLLPPREWSCSVWGQPQVGNKTSCGAVPPQGLQARCVLCQCQLEGLTFPWKEQGRGCVQCWARLALFPVGPGLVLFIITHTLMDDRAQGR